MNKGKVNFFLLFILLVIFILLFIPTDLWSLFEVKVYFFYAPTCPFCREISLFLSDCKEEYPNLKILQLDASQAENRILYSALAEAYEVEGRESLPLPIVFIGDRYFLGGGEVAKVQIKNELQRCSQIGCPSPLEKLSSNEKINSQVTNINQDKESFSFWLVIIFLIVLFFLAKWIFRKK